MRAWLASLILVAAGAVSGCAREPHQIVDAAAVDKATGAADTSTAVDVPPDRAMTIRDTGRGVEVPPDTSPMPPDNVHFPDAPEIACGDDDAGACGLPASACADVVCDGGACDYESFQWIVYYDNPRCVSGRCVFENRYFRCSGSYACWNGGCQFNGTAIAAP